MKLQKRFNFHVYHSLQQGIFQFFFRQLIAFLCLLVGIGLSLPGIPGPGFVFIIMSFLLFSYPGKKQVVKWLSSRRFFKYARVYLRQKWNINIVLPRTSDIPSAFAMDWVKYIIVFVFRLLLIAAIILAIEVRQFDHVALATLTFCLTFMPALFEHQFKVDYPNEFEILVVVILFLSLYFGEIHRFYDLFRYWDLILHGLTSIMSAIFAFSLVILLNREKKVQFYSAGFKSLFAFSFAAAMGGVWEVFEYTLDHCFGFFMQRGSLADTMEDLIVDFVAALAVAFIGYFYLKFNLRVKIIEKFKLLK